MINPFNKDQFARYESESDSMIVPIRFEKKEEVMNEVSLP